MVALRPPGYGESRGRPGVAHTYFLMKQTEEPERVLVWDTRTLSVGRSTESAVVLDDADVSRKHSIFVKEIASFISDLEVVKKLDCTPARDIGWQPRSPEEATIAGWNLRHQKPNVLLVSERL